MKTTEQNDARNSVRATADSKAMGGLRDRIAALIIAGLGVLAAADNSVSAQNADTRPQRGNKPGATVVGRSRETSSSRPTRALTANGLSVSEKEKLRILVETKVTRTVDNRGVYQKEIFKMKIADGVLLLQTYESWKSAREVPISINRRVQLRDLDPSQVISFKRGAFDGILVRATDSQKKVQKFYAYARPKKSEFVRYKQQGTDYVNNIAFSCADLSAQDREAIVSALKALITDAGGRTGYVEPNWPQIAGQVAVKALQIATELTK